MRHLPARLQAILLCVALAAGAGCRKSRHDVVFRVGVLVPTGTTPVAEAMRRGMEASAKAFGVGLLWRDGDAGDPRVRPTERELRLAADLLERERVQALVYTPLPESNAVEVLREAQKAAVPVVCLDVLPPNVSVGAFVAPDFIQVGEEIAAVSLRRLAAVGRQNIEGQFNTLVVEGRWGQESNRETTTGFYRTLDNAPEVRVVGRTAVENPTEAFRFVSGLIHDYARNVQLLLVADSDYVPAAVLAAKTHGVAEWLVSAGVGAGEEACRLVYEELHDLEMDLMPAQRAARAVELAIRLAKGDTPTPDGYVQNGPVRVPFFVGPTRVISRENVSVMSDLWRDLFVR
jgi:ABC-type sugar transport system substrate-binding protein